MQEELKPSERWRTARSLPIQQWSVQRWQGDQSETRPDRVVIEEPFEVRLNGRSLAVIMRTPGDDRETDRELAMGFLLSEGVISDPAQVEAIVRDRDKDGLPEENVLNVLAPAVVLPETKEDEAGRFERRFVVGSSCGLCGKNSIEEACRRLPPLDAERPAFRVKPDVIYGLPETLRAAQAVFDRTGGLHAAGLFTPDGRLELMREDVGRHNAVDKLVGRPWTAITRWKIGCCW